MQIYPPCPLRDTITKIIMKRCRVKLGTEVNAVILASCRNTFTFLASCARLGWR